MEEQVQWEAFINAIQHMSQEHWNMARTAQQWHSDELAHYIRPSTAACDFDTWEV